MTLKNVKLLVLRTVSTTTKRYLMLQGFNDTQSHITWIIQTLLYQALIHIELFNCDKIIFYF